MTFLDLTDAPRASQVPEIIAYINANIPSTTTPINDLVITLANLFYEKRISMGIIITILTYHIDSFQSHDYYHDD